MKINRSFQTLYTCFQELDELKFLMPSGKTQISISDTIVTPNIEDPSNAIKKGLLNGLSVDEASQLFIPVNPPNKKNIHYVVNINYFEELEHGDIIQFDIGKFTALQSIAFYVPEKGPEGIRKTNRQLIKDFIKWWKETYHFLHEDKGKNDSFIRKAVALRLSIHGKNLTFEDIQELVTFGVSTEKILAGMKYKVDTEMIQACSPLPYTEILPLFMGLQEDADSVLQTDGLTGKLSLDMLLKNNLKRKRQ